MLTMYLNTGVIKKLYKQVKMAGRKQMLTTGLVLFFIFFYFFNI